MNYSLVFRIFIFLIVQSICAKSQSVWQVLTPEGYPVLLDKDSSFVSVVFENIAMYSLDDAGNRNVLVTNGEESHWLFHEGKLNDSKLSPFQYFQPGEFLFMIDNVWYRSDGTQSGTSLYYDNNDSNNGYAYLEIFNVFDNIGISAIRKSTGELITLLRAPDDHFQQFEYKDTAGHDIQIFRAFPIGHSLLPGVFFAGSVFSSESGNYTVPGFYRMRIPQIPVLQFDLGQRSEFSLYTIEWGDSYLVDKLDNGMCDVYRYNASELFENVTSTVFNGEEIWDIQNIRIPWDDVSMQGSVWKTNGIGGEIHYTIRDGWSLGLPEWEIEDLRGVSSADFIMTFFDLSDTLYYYNYDDPENTLVRTNYRNGQSFKQPTSSAIDVDFKLRGFDGVMYYTQYDSKAKNLVAFGQDILNGGAPFCLESQNGDKIVNPIDFLHFGNYLFVKSKSAQDSEVSLYVYDSTKTVGIDRIDRLRERFIEVSPNPSYGEFAVRINSELYSCGTLRLDIRGVDGLLMKRMPVDQLTMDIDLTVLPNGLYHLTLECEGKIIDCEKVIIVK